MTTYMQLGALNSISASKRMSVFLFHARRAVRRFEHAVNCSYTVWTLMVFVTFFWWFELLPNFGTMQMIPLAFGAPLRRASIASFEARV